MLITRPEPQASRLAVLLRDEGLRVILSPLMQTSFPVVALPQGRFAALLFTSEAGALAAGRMRASLPDIAICVGNRTVEVARAAGFEARFGGATAEQLLSHLAQEAGPFLYLRGRDASVDLAAVLNARGQAADSMIVYAQEPAALTDEACAALQTSGPVVVPLYSARSADLFLNAIPMDTMADVRPVVIAAPVAESLPGPLQQAAVVAETPEGKAMLQAILRVIRSLVP